MEEGGLRFRLGCGLSQSAKACACCWSTGGRYVRIILSHNSSTNAKICLSSSKLPLVLNTDQPKQIDLNQDRNTIILGFDATVNDKHPEDKLERKYYAVHELDARKEPYWQSFQAETCAESSRTVHSSGGKKYVHQSDPQIRDAIMIMTVAPLSRLNALDLNTNQYLRILLSMLPAIAIERGVDDGRGACVRAALQQGWHYYHQGLGLRSFEVRSPIRAI